MNFSLQSAISRFRTPERRKSPVEVGWWLDATYGTIIYSEPERVRTTPYSNQRVNVKSASRCPALLDLESRHYVIRCPFDLNLGITKNNEGQWVIIDNSQGTSGMRPEHLRRHIHLVSQKELRNTTFPILQIAAPYRFIADEPVYISQTAPFMHFTPPVWPGVVFGGRFRTDIWPRSLMWAFEWHDTQSPLILTRGMPWFYVSFEASNPERKVHLVEAEITPELTKFSKSIDGITNTTKRTFSLFPIAAKRRPPQLLKKKTTSG